MSSWLEPAMEVVVAATEVTVVLMVVVVMILVVVLMHRPTFERSEERRVGKECRL